MYQHPISNASPSPGAPLTPVKSLSDKPYIVYPSQHIRTGYRKLSVNVLFFRLLRQDCEVFFIILYANERQDTKTYSDFNVEDAAHLRGRIAGHRPGKRGVPLFCHDIGNEKTECLMRKQEYKEQEQKRPRRYYFFDYLFWLGEMAQQHYKGEPRRPDGDSMLMLCIMVVVLGPIITIVLCFDPPVRDFLAIAMIICSVVIVYLPGRIYSPARRKAVMRHYAGRKFSPARCYFFLFSLGFLLIANIPLWGTVLKWIDKTIK